MASGSNPVLLPLVGATDADTRSPERAVRGASAPRARWAPAQTLAFALGASGLLWAGVFWAAKALLGG